MKHFLILSAGLGLSLSLSAQQNDTFPTDYECLYEYRVTNSKSITDTYTTILQIGRDCSCFMDYTAFQSDSVNASPHASDEDIKKYQMQEIKNSLFFDQTVLQNHPFVFRPDGITEPSARGNVCLQCNTAGLLYVQGKTSPDTVELRQ